MDNHSFPNASHVSIAQHPDNDVDNHTDNEDMPVIVPLDADHTEPQQQAVIDVEMNEHPDSESDRDAYEVEMQTVNNHHLRDHAVPDSPPTPRTFQDQPAVNNRRARVEDDEDEDRDRRHPSQRIGNSANATSSAGLSSSTPIFPPQVPAQPTPGTRLRGQAPIFSRIVVDEATRAHPFRFFQHLMSNNNNTSENNDAGNTNPVPSSGGPMPASQPHQDGNTPDDQPRGQLPINIEGFSVTLDIGVSPAFHMGGGAQPSEGQPSPNAAGTNPNANPNAQNGPSQVNFADFMARLSQIMGLADITEGTSGTAAPAGENNPDPGPGGPGATPGAQFGFNLPAGGFNLANLAGLGFGFHLDGTGFREFAEKEDPERARKLVDGIEEVPVGLVRRLERVGGTGGGMGEDETKGGDGGCAICWDRLLGGSDAEDVHWHTESEKKEEKSDEASKPSTPKIVSLPCAHVFHAECLIPWFSRPRQTTCPTCRFNIDPENLTYVSWRRRMRERRERERAEARARGNAENTDGNEAGAPSVTATTPAGPADAPVPDAPPAISEHVLNLLSTFPLPSDVNPPPQTSNPSVLNAYPTPTPHIQSQPEAAATSSTPAASTSQSSTQPITPPENSATDDTHAHAQETEDDWNTMPALQDVSDSDSEGEEEDEEEEEDEDEDEDEDEEVEDEGEQEQGNGDGVQATPVLPHANERPTASTSGAQAPPPRQNGPFAPRTIQTAHGLVTLIPVPFNLPFPTAGNGFGMGVQAGGNAVNANTQVPSAAGQDRLPNANANNNIQDPHGLAFSHFHSQFLPMPEFGAQRGATTGAPAPANTTPDNANANLNQAVPTNRFVNAQEAATITNTEQRLMEHLLSQGLTADEAEGFRRVTVTGRRADRLRRGEDPTDVEPLDLEDEDDEDDMDIDEGMDMVVDLAMDQGGIDGAGIGAAIAQNEQDRQDFAQILNFLRGGGETRAQAPQQEQGSQGASAGTSQAQAETQAEGQAPRPEQGTESAAAGTPNAQGDAPQQSQPQQQQGQGFAPFIPGLNPGINVGNIGPADGRTINELVAQMFTAFTGASQPQARQQAQANQSQAQPQTQAQAEREATETPPANNNSGRPRQQTQFTFGNVTIGPLGPFNNFGSLFNQMPTFDSNNTNGGAGQERVKKEWTLPPAPGPTLRQRIERRERDAGLRCYDISCGVGPSDEDPVVSDEIIAAGLQQLMIMNKSHGADRRAEGVCKHTFHPGCLVSAERVALGSTDVTVIESGYVEVSCPVCRSTGCVTKQEWDQGILALS